MKKFFLSLTVLFASIAAFAQIENPVKWAYSATRVSDKVYEIHMTATIDPKWHIYAQDAGEGPEPNQGLEQVLDRRQPSVPGMSQRAGEPPLQVPGGRHAYQERRKHENQR